MAALVLGLEADRAQLRLARRNAHLRHLHAVVRAVAQDVHQRVGEQFEHTFVDFGVLAFDHQADLLVGRSCQVADHPRI
ncbi:MAG: hypothetical protein ACOCWR_10985, partial [Oceanidesulfovibrio sp.]